MMILDPVEWANTLFGHAQLGDARRTKRLVQLASDLSKQASKSISQAAKDPASLEGAYRFIRNPSISPDDIADAGYAYTNQLVQACPLVLALQDTTGLSYTHSVCDELGDVNSACHTRNTGKGRTLYAHSTLMVDANNGCVLGLAYQHYWYRDKKQKGKSHALQTRDREDKESYKWQNNLEQVAARFDSMDQVIDVCDREADMYEYLAFQLARGHRFVVRAKDDRRLANKADKLFDTLNALEPCAHYSLTIPQKGGRRARTAQMALSYTQVALKKPQRAKAAKTITVNTVVCQEIASDGRQKALRWVLHTTEPLRNAEDARAIVRYYELRWKIEEYHKLWKTEGTQVENLRMQSRDNLRRVAVIQAFIAVRLFQLRQLAQNQEEAKAIPCTVYFRDRSWKILWKATRRKEALPEEAPSLHWAYYAMARLGGWHDSKRTGRVGMVSLWEGWLTLMLLVESYDMLRELEM